MADHHIPLKIEGERVVGIGAPKAAQCGSCDGSGVAYSMIDETEIGQAPGSSGFPCPECTDRRAAISKAEGR